MDDSKIRREKKRKSENERRRKCTLIKKAYELRKYHDIEVVIILRKNSRYFTYRSIDHDCWPPAMRDIVSYVCNI